MTFTIKDGKFCLNGKKVFLNSGEIHYFRIKRELWSKHLEAAKDAGLTTISSYVPWAWHEPEKGVFDFDGTSCPERDLNGWLQLCQDHGLTCIVKPGPFILAETRGAGLPDWFLEEAGAAVKMHNRKGALVASDGVSLFNINYLKYVELWYNQIIPLIGASELPAGGPVIMVQICNEIGVFSWLAHQADYNDQVRDRFVSFLENKFQDISEVNGLWGTDYLDFSQVELPPDGRLPYESKEDRGRDYEWHCFWRIYYGDYLRMLTNMARERGITVPVYHNLPGWIYGSGYEFPVNITMYEDLYGDKSEILFGVDHIPEYVSYRNMHDDRIINDITLAMQGNKPLFAAEFQSGSREYHVVTNPREMELFYKASIANGLTGWNHYMFSQGRNPRHRGYSGETFYWFNPLTPEGERTNAFPLVRHMSQLVNAAETLILEANRKAEICVLFYPPYYATELERPETGASELNFNASSIRRPAYFDGLLKVLQLLNIDYDMADLCQATADQLSRYKQVWAFATDEMNSRDQQVIVDYTTQGGHLVIFPYLPDREFSQKPCTILRDALGTVTNSREVIESPLIDIYDHKDIKCANPQITYSGESLSGAEIIARTIRGTVCGFTKALGTGSVVHLGTWIGFDTEGHKPVYETILSKSGAKLRQASANSDKLVVRERFTNDQSAILFIGNYYNEENSGKVSYTHPETSETITIPYLHEYMLWPALYGVLTPVCMQVSAGLKILHTTSDILRVETMEKKLIVTLLGDRDLLGELVLEGPGIKTISEAFLENERIEMNHHQNRIVLNYSHKHRVEMVLSIESIS
jgi:beta-galactosidase